MGDLEIVGWRAWYDNGRTYTSKGTEWEDLPSDGLQIVVLYYKDGNKRIMMGADYYFRAAGPIYGTSNEKPDSARYPGVQVKRGRWVPDHVFEEITQKAHDSKWGG